MQRWELENTTCTVCHAQGVPCRYIDLYTIGSEGTVLCQDCQNKTIEFLRGITRDAMTARRDAAFAAKREREQLKMLEVAP